MPSHDIVEMITSTTHFAWIGKWFYVDNGSVIVNMSGGDTTSYSAYLFVHEPRRRATPGEQQRYEREAWQANYGT